MSSINSICAKSSSTTFEFTVNGVSELSSAKLYTPAFTLQNTELRVFVQKCGKDEERLDCLQREQHFDSCRLMNTNKSLNLNMARMIFPSHWIGVLASLLHGMNYLIQAMAT